MRFSIFYGCKYTTYIRYPTCAITGSVLTLICSIYLTKYGVKASKNLHN